MGQFDEKLQRNAIRESEIIYDSDSVIFLECNGNICLDYYSDYNIRNEIWNFYRSDRYSKVYFIVKKSATEPPIVWTIILTGDELLLVYHESDKSDFRTLANNFPELKEKLYEMFSSNNTYETLIRIKEGFEYDKYSLRRVDESISDIIFNKNNPVKSMIKLSFGYDEYIKLFYENAGAEEYGNVSFLLGLRSGYNYEFNDYYTIESDWKEGYLTHQFNQENKSKLIQLANFLSPGTIKEPYTESDFGPICEKLKSTFPREIDRIVSEFHDLDEESRRDAILDDVKNSFGKAFESFGIYNPNSDKMTQHVTLVQTLIYLYEKYEMQGFSIVQLLREIISKNDLWGGNYYENTYDYYGDFDGETFNKTVSEVLDNIGEMIEDEGFFVDLESYKKLLDRVSQFGIEKWNVVPANRKRRFMIQDIDSTTNKIKLLVRDDDTGKVEPRSFDLEAFNNFLSSPELF